MLTSSLLLLSTSPALPARAHSANLSLLLFRLWRNIKAIGGFPGNNFQYLLGSLRSPVPLSLCLRIFFRPVETEPHPLAAPGKIRFFQNF